MNCWTLLVPNSFILLQWTFYFWYTSLHVRSRMPPQYVLMSVMLNVSSHRLHCYGQSYHCLAVGAVCHRMPYSRCRQSSINSFLCFSSNVFFFFLLTWVTFYDKLTQMLLQLICCRFLLLLIMMFILLTFGGL